MLGQGPALSEKVCWVRALLLSERHFGSGFCCVQEGQSQGPAVSKKACWVYSGVSICLVDSDNYIVRAKGGSYLVQTEEKGRTGKGEFPPKVTCTMKQL
jgi:hypothetical protein